MIQSIKKSLFVTVGLTVIGLGLFLGNPSNVDAAVKEGQKFTDWVANCAVDANKKQVCFLTQSVNVTTKDEKTKEEKQQTIAVYQIGYFPTDKADSKVKKLKMIQMIPNDVSITPGTLIISNKKLLSAGKYIGCNKDFCNAMTDISDGDIKTILSSEGDLFVGIINSAGQQVNYPLSAKGLKDGLKALE